MIEKLVELSIRKKGTVLIIGAVFCIIGLFNAFKLPIDAVPDVTNVQVTAVTSSPGLTPFEVEQFITYPIELELNGIPGAKEIRSISRAGVSSVSVIFEDGTDIWFARQLVNERLKIVGGQIPPEYGSPELAPVATALGDIYEFTLSSDQHSPTELRSYIDWDLSRKLKSVPGVIEVNTLGGTLKQYQVLIDPKRLAAHNLTVTEILDDIKAANFNTGGGYVQKGEEQLVIRGEGQFGGIEELRRVAVRTSADGIPLLLGQIAKVEEGPALRFGIATQKGKEVVAATVIMLLGQNSRDVVDRVREKVNEVKPTLPKGMKLEPFYDRSEFINRALKTVFMNLSEGAVLVFLALVLTLGTAKGGALVAAAIPVSMLVAVIFMRQLGVVGNLMSLGALDFGLLVDGSIVMLESVLAGFYLGRKNFDRPMNEEELRIATENIISDRCKRVAKAAAFSVAIIMLVYLPLMVLEGVEGRMFRPMAITVALALASALIFSVTIFPASLAYAYKRPFIHKAHAWEKIEEYYIKLLEWGWVRKKQIILFSVGIIVFSFLSGNFLGSEFLPRIDEGELEIDAKRLPSTAIDYSRDLNIEIEEVLSGFPEIASVVSRVGRGESAAEPLGTEETSVMVKLKPKDEWVNADSREELMDKIKNKLIAEVPSTYFSMSQPIENRVNSLLTGSKADVVVKIYGDDLKTIKSIGDKIASTMQKVQGTGDLRVQRVLGLPMLQINTNYDRMARYGVSASEILRTVEMMRVGAKAGKIFEGMRRYDLVLRLDLEADDLPEVANIPIMTASGNTIPLGQVADIEVLDSAAAIYREALKRRIFVEVNIRGRDLVGYINEAKEKVQPIADSLPPGYEIEWGGQFDNFVRAKNRLILVVPVALAIIFFMLMAAFNSVYYALGVFAVVPLATAGGILGLVLRGLPFSIPAAVGFIAVSGIAVLNGVVYASTLKEEIQLGKRIEDAVISAGILSLRPVLTTEFIAAIGFLPMAISSMAGAEVQRPLATVVIAGVLVATALSRLVLPIVMETLLGWDEARIKRNEEIRRKKESTYIRIDIGEHHSTAMVEHHSEVLIDENGHEPELIKKKGPGKKRK
ncbi:efflux RND transporter permease subunit [Leptospira neocaledonica]|uniref:CusA/CzcA family heavy metal efflux RND transporter n=1 Tax=Leptospira neocaledonica TaxID=2023192 RepID=A0A2M9ZZC5_9LEPT|nr:CusA/CzcA family heavy metal efflux RND transporter [Leptospira neocaledonica]PJZ77424.1 CusA/CzcA family heavy metal efflux RND transporter [Leptospira neocaledonica]